MTIPSSTQSPRSEQDEPVAHRTRSTELRSPRSPVGISGTPDTLSSAVASPTSASAVVSPTSASASKEASKSWLNYLSFGLLGKK